METLKELLPLLIPVMVLAVPIFDLLAVVVIRLRHGRPIYIGDHCHISHRFARMGLSRAQAVLVVLLLGFVTGAGAVTLLWLPATGVAVVFAQTAVILVLVTILHTSASNGSES